MVNFQGIGHYFTLTFCVITVLFLKCISNSNGKEIGLLEDKDDSFTFFLFAQDWPTVTCMQGKSEDHKCPNPLPTAVKGWTIHGLWPSTHKSNLGPSFCNKSAPFNPAAIASLTPQLESEWPNLYVDTSLNSFWSHEWEKHGTCASSVNTTANEYLYFKQGLYLHQQLNLTGVLERNNIIPSDTKQYDANVILKTLTSNFNGIEPVVQCFKYKGQFYLGTIEVCFNKQFDIVDCKDKTLYFNQWKPIKDVLDHDDHLESCPRSGQIFYPTIHSV